MLEQSIKKMFPYSSIVPSNQLSILFPDKTKRQLREEMIALNYREIDINAYGSAYKVWVKTNVKL